MHKFLLSEIRFTQILLLSSLFFFLSIPAHAQYYLADGKQEASSDAYQNVDYSYFSVVSQNFDQSAAGTGGDCINGLVTMFFSIAGACVGLPLVAMCALRILMGNGIKSARIRPDHFADLYLDAPPQPLRWYDPHMKSLSEGVAK